ncbi:hypothetical protein, partial [Chitinimonas sp.]|uniref:hypothetical protein n=1 Tax=Chitinimonas sp. TaxID=1934313 RepID=UPI0035B3DB02
MSLKSEKGVNPAWLKSYAKNLEDIVEWEESCIKMYQSRILSYIANGWVSADAASDVVHESWEDLDLALNMYAAIFASRFERRLIEERVLDVDLASNCYLYGRLGFLCRLHRSVRFLGRHGFRRSLIRLDDVQFAVIGIVISDADQTLKHAHMLLHAYWQDYYIDADRPIFYFILQVLADYLDDSPISSANQDCSQPETDALLSCWRSTDLDLVRDACIAVCDLHTYRVNDEFRGHYFKRFPFEILMVFAMRSRLGLTNPTIDHPLIGMSMELLNTTLSKPDQLFEQVYARMLRDGFNEEEIYQLCLEAEQEIEESDEASGDGDEEPADARDRAPLFDNALLMPVTQRPYNVVVFVPESWKMQARERDFQITDQQGNFQFTIGAVAVGVTPIPLSQIMPGILTDFEKKYSFLRMAAPTSRFKGANWEGL